MAFTDPELDEIFDNFAFDATLAHSRLDARTRLMVQLASRIACGALDGYGAMLGAALTVGVAPVKVKEIVDQAVPYVGTGRVFGFVHATNRVLVARGVELPLPAQSTTTPGDSDDKGRAVQEPIVGTARIQAMRDNAPDDGQHLQRFLSAHCFGDHLARSGIDLSYPRSLSALAGVDELTEAQRGDFPALTG